MDDGSERSIAFASRVLTNPERNYSQIEKKNQVLYLQLKNPITMFFGRSFKINTNNKPLLRLFHEHKRVPSMAASGIQRWKIILSLYNYKSAFRPGVKQKCQFHE